MAAGGGIFSGVFNKNVKVPLQEAELVGTSSSNKNKHLQANTKKEFTPAQFNELSLYGFHGFVVHQVVFEVKEPAFMLHVFLVFVQ
jgi:hypothetical protein